MILKAPITAMKACLSFNAATEIHLVDATQSPSGLSHSTIRSSSWLPADWEIPWSTPWIWCLPIWGIICARIQCTLRDNRTGPKPWRTYHSGATRSRLRKGEQTDSNPDLHSNLHLGWTRKCRRSYLVEAALIYYFIRKYLTVLKNYYCRSS